MLVMEKGKGHPWQRHGQAGTAWTLCLSFALPVQVRPVNDEKALQMLETIDSSELRPEFRKGLAELTRAIFQRGLPKRVGSMVLTGPLLAGLTRTYVDAINNGAVPCISTAWQAREAVYSPIPMSTMQLQSEGRSYPPAGRGETREFRLHSTIAGISISPSHAGWPLVAQGVAEAECRRGAEAAEMEYVKVFNTRCGGEVEELDAEHRRSKELANKAYDKIAIGDEKIKASCGFHVLQQRTAAPCVDDPRQLSPQLPPRKPTASVGWR